jgi:glycosyltransferase involved in cell wall biosynthesis
VRLNHAGRILRWSAVVLAAAAAGWAWRATRRAAGAPPRIWRGPNGLHLVRGAVLADRAAGFASRSFIYATRAGAAYPLFRANDFDVVCEDRGWARDDWHWRALVDLLLHGDVRVAYFDSLLFGPSDERANGWSLRLIRLAGIRTIMTPHGMDVFYRSRVLTRFDWVARAQQDYPDWDLDAHRAVAQRRTALWCRHAHFVVSADSTCRRFLPRRDLEFKWFPVDCDAIRPVASRADADVVRVVHAPQHRRIKGTPWLVACIDDLRERQIAIELQLVERVARDEALRLYSQADILVDQLCMGAFGMFALEGLALGKPVLAYLDEEHLGSPVFDLPIVNATPANLAQVLAVLAALPELRERLGRAGRRAVETYQSIGALAQVWSRLYAHVWRGEPLALADTAHFSPARRPRAFTEDPADPAFWPVPVDDLLDAIRAACATETADAV